MATSAFKSTSRRGTASSNPPPKKSRPTRRSHSVSADSRAQSDLVISEFLNKRDNPLFCSATSPPDKTSGVVKSISGERGRSVSRNSSHVKKEVGRRGHSMSRTHYAGSQLQSEAEQDYVTSSNYHNQNGKKPESGEKGVVNDNLADMHSLIARKQSTKPSFNSAFYLERPDWEDEVSMDSLTEAEEKTIRAVCEQMKGDYVDGALSPSNGIYETVRSEVKRAILDIQSDLESAVRRNNTHAMTTTGVTVNPGAVELVSDIRKEYAKELVESQERATILRADLAIEEHRVQEISRILKETTPDPKTNKVQKSRSGRRRSNERKKMSKRLTEEAMAYFDECVSISTFDSSDFSAADDPPVNSVRAMTPVGPTISLMQDSSSFSTSCYANSPQNHNQDMGVMNSHMDSGLAASIGSNETVTNKELGRKSRFSFSRKPAEKGGLQQDIMSYVKNINQEFVEATTNSDVSQSNKYDMDLYMNNTGGDDLLFEMVISKSKIECGSLHLCGGGLAIMFPPFASII